MELVQPFDNNAMLRDARVPRRCRVFRARAGRKFFRGVRPERLSERISAHKMPDGLGLDNAGPIELIAVAGAYRMSSARAERVWSTSTDIMMGDRNERAAAPVSRKSGFADRTTAFIPARNIRSVASNRANAAAFGPGQIRMPSLFRSP